MTRGQLVRSYATWRTKEAAAHALWRSRVRRHDRGDPRRAQAHQAFVHTLHMRRRRRDQLARLPVATCDAAGIDAIIRREGLIPYCYADSQGHATFGVGHLIHRGTPTAGDYRRWGSRAHHVFTDAEARTYFVKTDLPRYEKPVVRALTGSRVPVTQGRLNACVSLAFNIGVGGFATSTVVQRMRAGDAKGAASAFMLWNKPPEIIGRRTTERDQFAHG